MTLDHYAQVKHWMLLHAAQHPVELAIWNLVMTCWVLSWMGLAPIVLTQAWRLLPVSLAAWLLPSAYARGRARLHRRGRLRCDWLAAAGS